MTAEGIQTGVLPLREWGARKRDVYAYDRHVTWLRYVGVVRIGVLSFLAAGAGMMGLADGRPQLVVLYAVGFLSSVWFLHTVRRRGRIDTVQGWLMLLVDFSIVAVTVSFTQGSGSLFTFMFVVVVLEAGLLVGFVQGFVLATLCAAFMLTQLLFPPQSSTLSTFEANYNFLVQSLSFYLTAFLSGYWNQRIYRLQEFQREILDNMNSGFLIADAHGVVTVQNRAARAVLGIQGDTAVGAPIQRVLRVASGGESPVVTAMRTGNDFVSYEFRALREDNDEILLGLTTNCMRDARGNVTGVIASFSDLTEMHAMREELRRQDRLAVVGELAAGLAHEIRNPLAVIRGSVEELGRSADNPGLEEKLRGMILRESDHLNEIVSGFLDFAREPSTNRQTVDVCELARETVESLRVKYRDSEGLTIELHIPETPRWISCDPSQLKQVFANLGTNGVEAMERTGRLRVVVDAHESPIDIRFEDEGPGIPPDKMARIFEPFFTTKQNGVGMGLAVCMRIVTAHDGTLRAAVREGGGCRMSVTLPKAEQNEDTQR